MSDRHWHRPEAFLGLRNSVGATWYIYRCECGKELPERRVKVPGITLPREPTVLTVPPPKKKFVAHREGPDGRCTVCHYRLGALAPHSCPGKDVSD